ncbi:hypothetical protein Pmani_010987 [Petrolisthes manimaculis]|uniref:Peptidase S1 domain-containing protein n=1 Tax=Petrolisthes manimaculis TaxID=1843537 RepID=A0AAE1UG46_9EUCA|nr:hypothetical protein Pmani_010987 [Petrolisthes manimaculis]
MKTGKSVGVERIVGGRVTEARQHPWVGGLVWQGALEVWCGGVLVSSSLLLTAAHCAQRILPGESHAEVIFLSTSPEKDEEAEAQIRRTIVEIKIHPDYDPLSLKHDLALMWLEEEEEEVVEEVVVESEVVPVCFPDGDKDYANYTGVVAGWGRIEEGGPLSQDLREVEIPILSNEVCSRLYPPGMIDNTVLCAGDTNKDACQVTISKADSGGPLVVMEEGVGVVLVGVVSWGRGCGRPNQPGVYVRVTDYPNFPKIRIHINNACNIQIIIGNTSNIFIRGLRMRM